MPPSPVWHSTGTLTNPLIFVDARVAAIRRGCVVASAHVGLEYRSGQDGSRLRSSEGVREGSDWGKSGQHEADSGDVDHRLRRLHLELVVLAEAAVAPEPGQAALHDPSQAFDLERALAAAGDDQLPAVVPQQVAGQLAAFVPRVGHHGADGGEERAQAPEQTRTRLLVWYVRRLDPARDRQAQRVHQDVALAAPDQLVPVKAARAAALGRLRQLPVHDDERWARRPSRGNTRPSVHSPVQAHPGASILPRSEIVVDRAPGREVTWQQASLVARAQQLEDRVQHRAQAGRARASAGLRRWQQRRRDGPLCVAQVRVEAARASHIANPAVVRRRC